jgi:hypothetical protein
MKTAPNQTAFETAPDKVNDTNLYAIALIETVLRCERPEQFLTETMLRRARLFLPYCLKPAGDGLVLAVNRDYQPLGVTNSRGAINYNSQKYAALRLPEAGLDRSLLDDGYFFIGHGPSSSLASDRWEYLFKLWWSLRGFGMKCPNIPIPAMEKISRQFGLDFQQVLGMSGALS